MRPFTFGPICAVALLTAAGCTRAHSRTLVIGCPGHDAVPGHALVARGGGSGGSSQGKTDLVLHRGLGETCGVETGGAAAAVEAAASGCSWVGGAAVIVCC